MLIAGDIGGTKTLLALIDPSVGARKPLTEAEFPSGQFASLDDIVRAFTQQTGKTAEAACFDVAGPVINGKAHLTNLPWQLDEAAMQSALGLKRVTLLNDLKAVAYAVPHLQPEDVHTISEGKPETHGPIAVVAPGTGLGEAYLVWNGTSYTACSSEGGHADFAPRNDLEAGLWRFLHQRFGHVAYERVCSGSGVPNIYDYLRDSSHAPEDAALAAKLAEAKDRTPLIIDAALHHSADALSKATLDIFVSVLAAETGNMALKLLSSGGVYLGGGLPPRILPHLTDGRFMHAFADKGRLSPVLQDMPVKIITNQAALYGAALYGLDAMQGRI
jgi:glucokinase